MRLRVRAAAMLLLVTAAALAGCAESQQAPTDAGPAAARPAAINPGAAPVGPAEVYRIQTSTADGAAGHEADAHPLILPSNAAREPVTIVEEGSFEVGHCTPDAVPASTGGRHWFELGEHLRAGDVLAYDIRLTFTNTDHAWGDIRLSYLIGGRYGGWPTPSDEARGEVTQNFTGQSYRISDEDEAWVAVACWHGLAQSPIPYTLRVTFTFTQNAVPAEVPLQFTVPEGATRLFVSGVPLSAQQGVLSHYRVFGPDDELLCECALDSRESTDAFALPAPGEYVILVDHTHGGFVALALDAPADELVALQTRWDEHPILTSEGGSVDETVAIDLPRVPLGMSMWFARMTPPGDAGWVRDFHLSVANHRGEALREAHGTYASLGIAPADEAPRLGGRWRVPLGEWEDHENHHAFDKGQHHVHVQAEAFRGTVVLYARTYERA